MCFKSRIVIAGEDWFGSTNFGLAQGFRRMAWEVLVISRPALIIQGRSLLARIAGRICKPINNRIYNREILQAVERFKPQFFLTVKGNDINPKTLNILESRGIKTVNFYPDFRFSYDDVEQSTFQLYSLFVTTKSFQLETLQKLIGKEKVHFIHHGYCSDVHNISEENHLCGVDIPEVLYVGTYSMDKESLFTAIIRSMPNISLRIYGHGWHRAKEIGVLKPFLAQRPIFSVNYAQLINAAKINLSLHMGVADYSGWQDLVSTRSFEIPACKGFMLHVDNSEIRQLYDVGSEIDVFSSAEDLCAKISFYLANEKIRKVMIEKAYQRCVPAYSYDQRAKEIALLIELNS